MASKSRPGKKSGSASSINAGDTDLIAKLKDRVAELENELRLDHERTALDNGGLEPANKMLEEQEKLLRNVFECIQDGVSVLDTDLNILRVNHAMEKWYGQVVGKKCYRAYHGRSRPCEPCPSIRAIRTGTTQTGVVRDLKGWREIYSFPMVSDHGKVTGVIEHVRDINERKRAEEALRESEANLDRAQRIAAIGNWEWDLKTNQLSGSREYYRMFGLESQGSAPFERFAGMLHPDDRKWVCEAIKDIRYDDLPLGTDFRLLLPDGSVRFIHSDVEAIYDSNGQPVKIFGTMQDISERKRAEEALRESEEKFRQLAENIDSMFWISSLSGDTGLKYLYMSPAFERIMGIPIETLYADPQSWIKSIHPDDRERFMAAMRKRMRGDYEDVDVPEYRIVKPDGTVRWIKARVYPIKVNDEVHRFAGIAEDITGRKLAEEELKAAKRQAELYVDLMGHDINNMNQVSMGFLELAHNIIEMEGKLGEDNVVLLDKAMNSLNNSSQLIDSVRKLQRQKMGLYEAEVIDVAGMVEDVTRLFHNIPGRDVKIAFTPRKHCRVKANSLLKDVFINLVGNAVKHSKGALTVKIKVDRVTDNGKKYCSIAVEDNGPGIPDELKATLFDRLNLTTTRARGKGFGLYLIKMLVDDYRGKFWVEDRVKGDHTKGARFVVQLPAVEN